ncbi:phage holin family protein [Priestia taiwanensis]|uniref:phage holin family protein n=1 Tax=Priestia taiwanensis TaxID=1347902 RepID=UPI00166F5F22|nr:phage holin family protein [Priestia taiwanensis]
MRWLLSVLVNSVLLLVIAGFFPDTFFVQNVWTAVMASFLLSILNVLVKPFLILITLPVTILSLGFFLFVINAITLLIADSLMGSAFEISGFGMALGAAIMLSILNFAVQKIIVRPLSEKK